MKLSLAFGRKGRPMTTAYSSRQNLASAPSSPLAGLPSALRVEKSKISTRSSSGCSPSSSRKNLL
eukprot:12170106-Alexandrium_andersonii.AAC.1